MFLVNFLFLPKTLCLTQSKRHANDSIHFLAIFSGALTPSDFEIFEVSSEKESVLPTII